MIEYPLSKATELMAKMNGQFEGALKSAMAFQIVFRKFEKAVQDSQKPMQAVQKMIEQVGALIHAYAVERHKEPDSVKVLLDQGWYVGWNTHHATANHLAGLIATGKHALVDKEMIELLDNELEHIRKRLFRNYPKRRKALKAAIDAHQKGNFYLSIPVFFAQSDGICRELTDKLFFVGNKKNRKPATAKWAEQFESTFAAMTMPLEELGITRKHQSFGKPVGINRHDVLHGASLDYGENPINSYKALSLLNYIGLTIYELKGLHGKKHLK